MDSSEHVGFETSQVLKDVDAYSISVELLSWQQQFVTDKLTSPCSLTNS